jgi:hypothetical protein
MSDTQKTEADIGPAPGPNFVRIRWLRPVGGHEPIGGLEWAECRRAVSMALRGDVELADGVDALPPTGRDHWIQGLRELSAR